MKFRPRVFVAAIVLAVLLVVSMAYLRAVLFSSYKKTEIYSPKGTPKSPPADSSTHSDLEFLPPGFASAARDENAKGSGNTTRPIVRSASSRSVVGSLDDDPTGASRAPIVQPEIPWYWALTSIDGYTLSTDHDIVNTGASSAVISSLPGEVGPDSSTALFEISSASELRGKKAQFTVYLFAEDDFGTAEVWLRIDDPSNPTLPIVTVYQVATVAGSTGWVLASVTNDVSPTAMALTFGVILHGPGPLWVDTAKLSIIESNGTISPVPSGRPDLLVGPVRRYPQNMDFEDFTKTP